MNILNDIDLLINKKELLDDIIENINIKMTPKKIITAIRKNKEQVKDQLKNQILRLCNEFNDAIDEEDISMQSGKFKSILATLSTNIKNDKIVYFDNDIKKIISFKDLFNISDGNYELLMKHINATKLMDVPPINLLENGIGNICNFILNNNPLQPLESIETTKPKQEYKHTIFIDKDGIVKCGNKIKPKVGQITYENFEDCRKGYNDANNFYFTDQNIKKLVVEFWNNKQRPQINKKDVTIPVYADYYLGQLVKTNENKDDIETATRLINYYKTNYKYIIFERKDKTKGCGIGIPKTDQVYYNTWKECSTSLKIQK